MLKMVATTVENVADPIVFDDFWILYSRHEAKKDALKAWGQLSEPDKYAAVVAAFEWRRIWAGQGRATQHTPLAASWLRAERWDDEIPPEFTRPTHQSMTLAKPQEEYTKAAIPQRVKDALAKLLGKGST